MGRKSKAENYRKIAKEGKTFNSSSEMENTKEKEGDHTDKSTVVDSLKVENYMHSSPSGLSSKNKVVRRSRRLNGFIVPCRSQGVETVVVDVDLAEKEKEESSHHPKVSTVPVLDKRNLEEKVDYLVQAIDALKSEVIRTTEEVPSNDFGYKSMYISSQKKIESLMEENCRLTMRLEFARGKIEAYERMKDVMCATKDLILGDSRRRKSNENTVQNCFSPIGTPDASGDDHQKTSPSKKKRTCKSASDADDDENKHSKQGTEKQQQKKN